MDSYFLLCLICHLIFDVDIKCLACMKWNMIVLGTCHVILRIEISLSESFSNQTCSPLVRYLAHLIGH